MAQSVVLKQQPELKRVCIFYFRFEIGPQGVHIGLTTYGGMPEKHFWLSEYTNKTALLEAIDNVEYSGGSTHTAEALDFMKDNGFTPVS